VLLNDEAKVRSEVRRAIAGAEPIEDPEAAEEHMSSEVPGREPPSNGYVSGLRLEGHRNRYKYEKTIMPP
jgi:hypothetical protein